MFDQPDENNRLKSMNKYLYWFRCRIKALHRLRNDHYRSELHQWDVFIRVYRSFHVPLWHLHLHPIVTFCQWWRALSSRSLNSYLGTDNFHINIEHITITSLQCFYLKEYWSNPPKTKSIKVNKVRTKAYHMHYFIPNICRECDLFKRFDLGSSSNLMPSWILEKFCGT